MERRLLKGEADQERAATLIMDSFSELNPYWKKLPPHPSDFRANILHRIRMGDKHDMAVGYYLDNELAIVAVMCPMEEYLSARYPVPQHPESEIYPLLAPYFAELDKSMAASLTGRKAFMFDILAANMKLVPVGFPAIVNLISIDEQAKRGYEEAYGMVTNPTGMIVSSRRGHSVLKQVTVEDGKLKGFNMYATHLQDLRVYPQPMM